MKLLESLTGPRWTTGLFVLLATLWGTSFVAIEIGLHSFPPLYFAGARYLVAGAIIMAFAWATNPDWLPSTRGDWITIGIFAVFIIFGNHAFLYLGEQYVPGAVAAVIVSLSPVLTVAFASVILGRGVPRLHELIGFVLGIAGVVAIAQPDPTALDYENLLGIGLVFLAAASFAVGGVLSRPYPTSLSVETVQAWSMLTGALLLVGVGRALGESVADVEVTMTGVLALAYLTLLSGVVAFMLYFTLLDRVGPTQLNLVGYLEPVAASLMGWVILGHVVATGTVVGFGFIVLGFVFIQRDLLMRVIDDTLPWLGDYLHRTADLIDEAVMDIRRGYRLTGGHGKR
jgi:drug/metabolite transporter (DMT)-like permease